MIKIPTPHIEAKKGDFAKTVLMPGDPLRAKVVADTFLENVVEVNKVRNMLAYTGEYKGKKISVMGSGMGMPSMGIYSYELFNFYDVDNIIRIGSAGGLQDDLELSDLVIASAASTNSNFASQYNLSGTYSAMASYELLEKAVNLSRDLGIKHKVGNILSSDIFYDDNEDSIIKWVQMGILAVEMEAAALYMNAARARKNALCILTISDLPLKNLSTTAEERQNNFTDMMKVALEIAE